jgi:hypothetical protein
MRSFLADQRKPGLLFHRFFLLSFSLLGSAPTSLGEKQPDGQHRPQSGCERQEMDGRNGQVFRILDLGIRSAAAMYMKFPAANGRRKEV